MHPFHPDSPEYPAMIEAGRAGPAWRPATNADGCGLQAFDREDRCGEPIAGSMQRSDLQVGTKMPVIRACKDHLLTIGVLGRYPFDVTYWCSVCETPVDAGYRLDASGRCKECQP
jgi:hypothetical protein